jgi:hypothetical protein
MTSSKNKLLMASQSPRKSLVQQRLLQRRQRSVLPFVEAGEALGFGFVHDLGIGFPVAACAAISPGHIRWPA